MIGIVLSLLAMVTATETDMVVTYTSPKTEIVGCMDVNGNCWEFYGDGFTTGDYITVVKYGNRIVEVR